MALIGVTFATFAGQSLINSRNFGQGVARPQAEALMDLRPGPAHQRHQQPALGDPGPQPAPRHVRQRLGLPGLQPHRPTRRPRPACFLSSVFVAGHGDPTLHFTGYQVRTSGTQPRLDAVLQPDPVPDQHPHHRPVLRARLHPLDRPVPQLSRPRISGNAVPQSFEVLEDDASGGFHMFTLEQQPDQPDRPDPNAAANTLTSGDWTRSFI